MQILHPIESTNSQEPITMFERKAIKSTQNHRQLYLNRD